MLGSREDMLVCLVEVICEDVVPKGSEDGAKGGVETWERWLGEQRYVEVS